MSSKETKFTTFAEQFLAKHGNQLPTEEQAFRNLEAATVNSARLNTLCEQVASELPALGLSEQQHEQLTALLEAFYQAGVGDGINYMLDYSEPHLKLGAALLAERYYRKQDGGGKVHPLKPLALKIANELREQRPELKRSDLARLTRQRLEGQRGAGSKLPAKDTVRDWIYKAMAE